MLGWSSPSTRRRRARVSSPSSRATWPADPLQAEGEVVGGGQGVGVVLAQDAAAAGQGVFVQLPGRLALADPMQADGQAVERRPGCRGGPRPARGGGGPGCLGLLPGPPGTRRGDQRWRPGCWREVRAPGCPPTARRLMARPSAEARVPGWSSPRTRRRRARVSSSSSRAAWYSPAARRLTARPLAAVRVSGWSSPRSRRRRARVSSSSCTWALPSSPPSPHCRPGGGCVPTPAIDELFGVIQRLLVPQRCYAACRVMPSR